MVLPDLRVGGAEKLHVSLASAWKRRGVSVEFVLLQALGELLSELPDDVKVINLDVVRLRFLLVPLVKYMRECQADTVLAAMWPLTALVPLAARIARFKGRVVVSEHSPLSIAYAGRSNAHRIGLRLSMRLTYPLADKRIAVSKGVADDIATLSLMPRDMFTVIYNPAAMGKGLDQRSRTPAEISGLPGPLVLSVGTLKRVKRFDLLLRAFAQLPPELNATLCILGEGGERSNLERLASTLALKGRVLFPGFAPDTGPWYAAADLFVLASEYEGFGNVIVEAMEYGVPIVSTDCPCGPREILCDGMYGRLVPVDDAPALAFAMTAALREDRNKTLLKERARDFDIEMIADQYLHELLPQKSNAK